MEATQKKQRWMLREEEGQRAFWNETHKFDPILALQELHEFLSQEKRAIDYMPDILKLSKENIPDSLFFFMEYWKKRLQEKIDAIENSIHPPKLKF